MKTRVAIIDDELLARNLIAEYLTAFNDIELIIECTDGFEGLKAIQTLKPDLVFLDIQMPKISGFELLELVEDPPAIIFTTAFDEFALKAFEANAVDYLLKPFSLERFRRAIEKYKLNSSSSESKLPVKQLIDSVENAKLNMDRIVVKNGADIRILSLSDIRYLEAYDDYVKIYTQTGMFLKKQALSIFENQLHASQFVRIHRSYLLNLAELMRIEPAEKDQHLAILKDKTRLPLSRSGYLRLKEALGL
jgi:two-component system LytT family response regulator